VVFNVGVLRRMTTLNIHQGQRFSKKFQGLIFSQSCVLCIMGIILGQQFSSSITWHSL